MDYPILETLIGIFAFGIVITGVVANGILRAKEQAKRAAAVERARRRAARSELAQPSVERVRSAA